VKSQLLIPAAGLGNRLGLNQPKALAKILGKPLLVWTLERFLSMDLADGSVITCPKGLEQAFETLLNDFFPGMNFSVIVGGEVRQESVAKGLEILSTDTDIVVIHDAARPFVTEESIKASIDAAKTDGAATVAIPCVDTILVADEDCYLAATPLREALWACQTPQTFQTKVIREAHAWAVRERYTGTDDASLVRAMGRRVKLVMGTPLNFKVTTATDLAMAEHVIQKGLT